MDVGQPASFSSPYDAWRRLADVIAAGSALVAQDALLGDATQPAPLRTGSFRLRPGQLVQLGRAAPGAPCTMREDIEVVVEHEYEPSAHAASWGRSSRAFVDVHAAVLTRARLSGIHQPAFVARRPPVLRGTVIEQVLVFSVQYHLDLPSAE